MKLITIILIVAVKMCASKSSVYDWRVKTMEHDTDFGDDFKVQIALNKERQQDLLKISGKPKNMDYYSKPYYPFQPKDSEGKSIESDNRSDDKTDTKYEKPSLPSNHIQFNNYTQNPASEENDNKLNCGSNNNYDRNEHQQSNENVQPNDRDRQRPILNKEESEEFLNNFLQNKQGQDQHDNKNNNFNPSDMNQNCPTDQNENEQQKQTTPATDPCDYDKQNQTTTNGQTNFDIQTTDTECKNNETKDQKYDHANPKEESVLENHTTGKRVDIETFVGTNLFNGDPHKCFSTEDVALLATRKEFENLIPKDLPQCLLDDHTVDLLLNYFLMCHEIVIRTTTNRSLHLAQTAFYDTLGGYLHHYMVPVTKYSFYAGQISLNSAEQVLTLYEDSKKFLNTNGNGWKAPMQNVLAELKSAHVEPLHIPEVNEDAHGEPSFCKELDMKSDQKQHGDNRMIVELPKLDAVNKADDLGNIWLPFKHKKTFDLESESDAYIVVKFYETVTKCYHFEKIDQKAYNEHFKTWLQENITKHLSDDKFYPGLGAILRVHEYLKAAKKDVIGIGEDVFELASDDERFKTYQELSSKMLPYKKKYRQNQTKNKHIASKNYMDDILKETNQNSNELRRKENDNQQNKAAVVIDNKSQTAVQSVPFDSTSIIRTLDFTPPQIAIIAIPVVAIILVVSICCLKRKKKKPVQSKKNSSSSSSTLFTSPVRFFHVRKNSAAPNEVGSKKNKKSVKIEKKSKLNSDTSTSTSPVRNKKSKEPSGNKGKGKGKDSGKSNSKSSWETTYSTK